MRVLLVGLPFAFFLPSSALVGFIYLSPRPSIDSMPVLDTSPIQLRSILVAFIAMQFLRH